MDGKAEAEFLASAPKFTWFKSYKSLRSIFVVNDSTLLIAISLSDEDRPDA